MATVNLAAQQLADLYLVISNLQPRDLTNFASIRKIGGALDAFEASPVKEYIDKQNEFQVKGSEATRQHQIDIKKLNEELEQAPENKKKAIQDKIDVLTAKANEAVQPINEEYVKWAKAESDKMIELEIDANYLEEIRTQFKKESIMKLFTSTRPYLKIAKALDIQD